MLLFGCMGVCIFVIMLVFTSIKGAFVAMSMFVRVSSIVCLLVYVLYRKRIVCLCSCVCLCVCVYVCAICCVLSGECCVSCVWIINIYSYVCMYNMHVCM